jgi:hypothetical protein
LLVFPHDFSKESIKDKSLENGVPKLNIFSYKQNYIDAESSEHMSELISRHGSSGLDMNFNSRNMSNKFSPHQRFSISEDPAGK